MSDLTRRRGLKQPDLQPANFGLKPALLATMLAAFLHDTFLP